MQEQWWEVVWEGIGWMCKRVTTARQGEKIVEVRWNTVGCKWMLSLRHWGPETLRWHLLYLLFTLQFYVSEWKHVRQTQSSACTKWCACITLSRQILHLSVDTVRMSFSAWQLSVSRPGLVTCIICAEDLVWSDRVLYKHRSICSPWNERLCAHKVILLHSLCIEQQLGPAHAVFLLKCDLFSVDFSAIQNMFACRERLFPCKTAFSFFRLLWINCLPIEFAFTKHTSKCRRQKYRGFSYE